MKEEVLRILTDVYEAKEAIEINDLIGLTTPEEYRTLEETLEELVNDFIIYKAKTNRIHLLYLLKNMEKKSSWSVQREMRKMELSIIEMA